MNEEKEKEHEDTDKGKQDGNEEESMTKNRHYNKKKRSQSLRGQECVWQSRNLQPPPPPALLMDLTFTDYLDVDEGTILNKARMWFVVVAIFGLHPKIIECFLSNNF
jgi:hypothetical protein